MAKLNFKNDNGYVLTDRNVELLSNLEALRNELEYTESVYGVTITINASLYENYEKIQYINCEIKCDDICSNGYLYVYFDNFSNPDCCLYNNSNVYIGESVLGEDSCLNLNELVILMSMVNAFTKWRESIRRPDNE